MLWSYMFDEQALVTLFKEQVRGSLDNAEPWCSPVGLYLVETVPHVSLEQKRKTVAALTGLDGVHLSLLPEKSGFMRV